MKHPKPVSLFGRVCYAVLRRIHPKVREQYRLSRLSGRVGYWEETQEYLFRFIKQMGLEPGHTLLDIGCGPLSGGLDCIRYLEPGNYAGIDIEEDALAEGRKQLAQHGLKDRDPLLVTSWSFGRDELGDRTFDFIRASQMLYHLDDEAIGELLEQVAVRLAPGGRFYGDVLGASVELGGSEQRWRGFNFFKHEPDELEARGEALGLQMRNLGPIEQYGFPVKGGLRLNNMIEFRRKPVEAGTGA